MKKKLFILCLCSLGLFLFFGYFINIQAKEAENKFMKKKILVVYYSHTGHTRKVAQDIASKLNADIEELIDKKNRSGFINYFKAGKDASQKKLTEINDIQKKPGNYDLIIIGTPVWAWSMTPAVRTYVTKYKNNFKQIASFCTAGGAGMDKVLNSINELAGKKSIVSLSYARKELKNQEIYNKKMNEFIESIKKSK